MDKTNIRRSMLFVPANNWKMLNKATAAAADCVIIDLEDSCPHEDIEKGRQYAVDIASRMKQKDIEVLVRVNALSTGITAKDINFVVVKDIDGIMLPKAETAEDISELNDMIESTVQKKGIQKKIEIVPLIESPKGIFNLSDIITASDKITILCFGAMDYMRELGQGSAVTKINPMDYFSVLLFARSLLATTASATGMTAIDTPFLGQISDIDGLKEEAYKVKMIGFNGKMAIHPKQIKPINKIFSPSQEDIEFSKKMVEAYTKAKNQRKGAAVLDGKMIDAAMYKAAVELLLKANTMKKKEKICTD